MNPRNKLFSLGAYQPLTNWHHRLCPVSSAHVKIFDLVTGTVETVESYLLDYFLDYKFRNGYV